MAGMFRSLLKEGSLSIAGGRALYPDCPLSRSHIRGWTYSMLSNEGISYLMPSPIHHSFLSWILDPPETNFSEFQGLTELVIDVVKQFKPSQVFLPIRRAGPQLQSDSARPPEAQYQDEFYRSIHTLSSGAVCISPEFASSGKARVAGRIDFFIPKMGWGIEITREGSNLREHMDRFSPHGAYGAWISSNEMSDYILLDCRTSEPRAQHPGKILEFMAWVFTD